MNASAERRQITVMFCDLVDSTGLARDLDPEVLREVMFGFHAVCSDIIQRCGGRVSQYLGDGLLAVFGHPRAHEDDAVHAAQSALSIVQQVHSLGLPREANQETIRVRIGIATGLVVTGDGRGTGPDGHEPISGQTPILAQRLQAMAAANSVLIADSTHAIVGGRFECIDLGAHQLKGFPDPQRVWQVVSPRDTRTRFATGQAFSPLVGRQMDLRWLLDLWEQVRQGGRPRRLHLGRSGDRKIAVVAGTSGANRSNVAYQTPVSV